jgi:hypothetical protein
MIDEEGEGPPSYPWMPVHIYGDCGCGLYLKDQGGDDVTRLRWYCSMEHFLDD